MDVTETATHKKVRTRDYNFDFDKRTGEFKRWGRLPEDDPIMSPYPEILDIEISRKCSHGCSFCYKDNTVENDEKMSLDFFKKVLSRIKTPILTQVALGIGDIDANPDLGGILEYCRSQGVIPNITINGSRMTPGYYDLLQKYCGAVSVSHSGNDSICFNAVKELTDRGVQTNIHFMYSYETVYSQSGFFHLLKSCMTDDRLKKMNALVLLKLKPCQRGSTHKPLSSREFDLMVSSLLMSELNFGFDSCSAKDLEDTLSYYKYFIPTSMEKNYLSYIEPCESTLFSLYIDVNGNVFPCSFCPGSKTAESFNIMTCRTPQEVWSHSILQEFRGNLLSLQRVCPLSF